MKRLYMVRHAKSSWDSAAATDYERPLNKRGLHDAPMMGRILRERGVRIDYLRSSSALRAITTARLLADELKFEERDIISDDNMYGAGHTAMIEMLRNIADNCHDVMLVGHNPGMHMLAEALAGFGESNLPTCGIVCARFEIASWKDIHAGKGMLEFYEYPKRHYRDA